MPLTTQEFDLEETLDHKYDERDDVAHELAELESDNPAFTDKSQTGNRLDTHIKGIKWALENWDVDAITLSGLTGGEYARLENELAEEGNGPGANRIKTIVHGTEDAPYLVRDDGTVDDAKTHIKVGQLPYDIQRWLEDEVNAMTSPGNLEQTFAQRVAEIRQQADGASD